MSERTRRVLITGGCGYIGSVLVPKVARLYPVTVVDNLWFGNHLPPGADVQVVQADIRDTDRLRTLLAGVTDVIHLAAIANDPASDLDPDLTRAINYEAVADLVAAAKASGVRRFISASSSSVYGVKDEPEVTEDLVLEPLTLYAKYKAQTETIVRDASADGFDGVSVRSATVCGHSPRMRFDVIVNIMTRLAVTNGRLTVHGGDQQRPNVHLDDITDCYLKLLDAPGDIIRGNVYNFGARNHSVLEIAEMVQRVAGGEIEIDPNVSDQRSYRISSALIREDLGIEPARTIEDAVRDICAAFTADRYGDPDDANYHNVKRTSEVASGPFVKPK
jgi:nucleoside-diphosphate-sugar epimerase